MNKNKVVSLPYEELLALTLDNSDRKSVHIKARYACLQSG